MPITIKIVKKTSDYELSLRDVKFHDFGGTPYVYTSTVQSPPVYKPPSGPWAASRHTDSLYTSWPGKWNAINQLVDYRCGYWGKNLRNLNGTKLDVTERYRYWHNFYTQEYDIVSSMGPGTAYEPETIFPYRLWKGTSGTQWLTMLRHLPTTKLQGNTDNPYDPNRLDSWEILQSFPEYMQDRTKEQITLTLAANHRHWFYDKLGKTRSADLGTFLATSPELIGLFVQLRSIVLNMKKPINLLKSKENNPVAIFKALKEIAGHWLTYSFGVAPLLSDMSELVEYVSKSKFKDSFDGSYRQVAFDAGLKYPVRAVKIAYGTQYFGIRNDLYRTTSNANRKYIRYTSAVVEDGLHKSRLSSLMESHYTYEDKAYPSSDYALHDHVQGTITRKASHEYLVKYSPEYILTQLGLNNPAMWAWELLPFSFVIDYVLKIGDFLENRNALAGIEVVASLHSIEEQWDVKSKWSQVRCKRYYRVTGNETDAVVIHNPASYLYLSPYSKGSLAIPRAEVEWADGIDMSKALDGSAKALNAAATAIILGDMVGVVEQAKRTLINSADTLPKSMQKQVKKLISLL